MTPFVNIFDLSFPFVIDFDIVERKLSLYYASAVFPATDCALTVVGFRPINKIFVHFRGLRSFCSSVCDNRLEL